MGKANALKDNMKGGISGLLQTAHRATSEQTLVGRTDEASASREPGVHCNFVMDKSIHIRMKYLALDKNMSLRDVVSEALKEYLKSNGK
jgi:hypothetical protein